MAYQKDNNSASTEASRRLLSPAAYLSDFLHVH